MAKNVILRPATKDDIDNRVKKLLHRLSNPTPPLELDAAREILELHRTYFDTGDSSLLADAVSKIYVAGVQIFKRPKLLVEAVEKWELKALYLPDTKRILIDKSVPGLKHRWLEAHEIGHSLLPWHGIACFGDNKTTVDQKCAEVLEAEANFAAGRLLFIGDSFAQDARTLPRTIESVQTLAKRYQNTITTTLWRYIEEAHLGSPMFALISVHPHPDFPKTQQPAEYCKHLIQSDPFASLFSGISEWEVFQKASSYCKRARGGTLGAQSLPLTDDSGELHEFTFETFFNSHEALTLGCHVKKMPASILVT